MENKWKNNCNTQNGKINLKIEIEFVIEKINDQSFDNNKDHPKIYSRINYIDFFTHFLKRV